jgi:hypothetical protein
MFFGRSLATTGCKLAISASSLALGSTPWSLRSETVRIGDPSYSIEFEGVTEKSLESGASNRRPLHVVGRYLRHYRLSPKGGGHSPLPGLTLLPSRSWASSPWPISSRADFKAFASADKPERPGRRPYGLPLPVQNDDSNAAPDHPEGNVVPNMGRPLTDASFVASSSMTSQCSASWPFSRRTISTTIQFVGRPMPVNRPWSST